MKNKSIWKKNQFYIKGNYNFFECEKLVWNGKHWKKQNLYKNIFDELHHIPNSISKQERLSLLSCFESKLGKSTNLSCKMFRTQITYKEYKYPEYWNKLFRSTVGKNKYELILRSSNE